MPVMRDLEKLGALDWAQDTLMLSDVEVNRLLEDVPAPESLKNEEFSTAWTPTDADTEQDTVYRVHWGRDTRHST